MLVGGPQPGGEDIGSADEWKCPDYRTGFPATSYTDSRCSYASNEVAINWNAPLAYLAGAIEALNAGYAPSFATSGVALQPTSIRPAVVRSNAVEKSAKLRFADQMLYIEKNGKRYNLNGHKIK
jgi:endoglucanase